MIESKDRSGWFGASDTSKILGNFDTKSFANFWLEKLGFISSSFTNDSLLAGTYYEHAIIDALGFPIEKDAQMLVPELRLRVNLDGNTADTIYEIKTHKGGKEFKVPIAYKRQVWVQMYATGFRKAYIVAYELDDGDYANFFHAIDKSRVQLFEIQYNDEFIQNTYLPRLRYLVDCLNDGRFPNEDEYKTFKEGVTKMC